jgi:hypothetical protein
MGALRITVRAIKLKILLYKQSINSSFKKKKKAAAYNCVSVVNWKIFLPRGMASNGISVNRGGPRLFTLPGKRAGTAEIDIRSIAAILEDSLSLADLDATALTLFLSFSSLT